MSVVLGIDAAWTANQPSGVALVRVSDSRATLVALAPSYAGFLAAESRDQISWERSRGEFPPVRQLLGAATRLAGAPIDIVAIDMPVASTPIQGRREADNAISKKFGAAKCATHSPSSTRPGEIGRTYTDTLLAEGFTLATSRPNTRKGPSLIEVYPHPAILKLLNLGERYPYKLSRSRSYWPNRSLVDRKRLLIGGWMSLRDRLANKFEGVEEQLPLPMQDAAVTFSALKPFEDALDALVCAWVGCCYLCGMAEPFGDEDAAIWVPA